MTRAEKYAEILRLRADGFTYQRIARLMGMSRSGIVTIASDLDGSKQKARRERYRGTCEDCGKKTDGSSGYNAPTLCTRCHNRRQTVWHREAIVEAIPLWASRHNGRPPVATDWQNVNRGSEYPAAGTVYNDGAAFSSWGEAIGAAGFPRPRGGQRPEDVAA